MNILCNGFCERHGFRVQLRISDEAVLTVYLFGLPQQRRSVRQVHTYAQEHPTGLVPALSLALERLAQQLPDWRHHTGLLDSMPIILAQGSRRFQAKVAPDCGCNPSPGIDS